MLTLQAKEKIIENLTPEKEFVRGTVGAICQVNFDEFWQNYEKWVVFKRSGCEPIKVMVDSLTSEIEIPHTILAESGEFQVGVFGVTESETLPTLYSDYIKIRYGTDTNATTPPKYTPNEIDQLRLSKQDKLTAGENITIDENNVISSTGGSITVDQTFNPQSENAQSGKAVAEALANVGGGDWELIEDITLTEDVLQINIQLPTLPKEIYVEMVIHKPTDYNGGRLGIFFQYVNEKSGGYRGVLADSNNFDAEFGIISFQGTMRITPSGRITTTGQACSGEFGYTKSNINSCMEKNSSLTGTLSAFKLQTSPEKMGVGSTIKVWGR